MKREKKNEIIMLVIIGIMCVVLFTIMFMQFKTIEETDVTAIENMREAELRVAIAEWKGKYEETQEQLKTTQESIEEYTEKIEKNEEASELIDKDLEESDMKLGKTDVYGEGIVLTLSDTGERNITSYDLLDLVNELRYAGAEAISINDVRILGYTYISQPQDGLTLIGGQRVTSPFVVKAIGNQTYLSSTLSLKDSGYIDKYRAIGIEISDLETRKNIEIFKDNSSKEIKYMEKGEEEQ